MSVCALLLDGSLVFAGGSRVYPGGYPGLPGYPPIYITLNGNEPALKHGDFLVLPLKHKAHQNRWGGSVRAVFLNHSIRQVEFIHNIFKHVFKLLFCPAAHILFSVQRFAI